MGARIRLRRQLLGISQADLGRAIGLTFQQVQKYERGTSRIGAGLLQVIANALDVPVSFFYDDYEGPGGKDIKPLTGSFPAPSSEVMSAREARLLGLWRQAPPEVADAVMGLLSACAEPGQHVLEPEEEKKAEEPAGQELPEGNGTGSQYAETDEDEAFDDIDEAERRRRRRRRGAIWDPADIGRTGRKVK